MNSLVGETVRGEVEFYADRTHLILVNENLGL